MAQLDQLARCLRQCSPEPDWSAQHWMIASTPFRMRLVGARKRLKEFVQMNPMDGNAAIHWAVSLNDVRSTAEQKLCDIEACLRTLQCTDSSPEERMQKTEMFLGRRFELLNALDEIQQLLSCQLFGTITDSPTRDGGRRRGPIGNYAPTSCQHREKRRNMVLTPATDSKLSADETHEYEKLKNELHDIDKRLRGIVDACEEMPNIVESGRLTPRRHRTNRYFRLPGYEIPHLC